MVFRATEDLVFGVLTNISCRKLSPELVFLPLAGFVEGKEIRSTVRLDPETRWKHAIDAGSQPVQELKELHVAIVSRAIKVADYRS
jgi:hypothetical protein